MNSCLWSGRDNCAGDCVTRIALCASPWFFSVTLCQKTFRTGFTPLVDGSDIGKNRAFLYYGDDSDISLTHRTEINVKSVTDRRPHGI